MWEFRQGCGAGIGIRCPSDGAGKAPDPPNSLEWDPQGSADGWRDPGWICVGIGAQDGILWELRGGKELGGLFWDLCRKEGKIPELFSRKNIPAEDEERAAGF